MNRINETINHAIVYSTCNLWYSNRQTMLCLFLQVTRWNILRSINGWLDTKCAVWAVMIEHIFWGMDRWHKGNNKNTEHRAIFQKGKSTDEIIYQPENWENRNGPDLVQAFPKKWRVESDFTDDIGHTWGVGHNNWTIIVRKDMDVNAPEILFNFPLRYNLKYRDIAFIFVLFLTTTVWSLIISTTYIFVVLMIFKERTRVIWH